MVFAMISRMKSNITRFLETYRLRWWSRWIPCLAFAGAAIITVFAPYQQNASLGDGVMRGVLLWCVVVLFAISLISLLLVIKKSDFGIWNLVAMIPALIYLYLNVFHSYVEVSLSSIGIFAVVLWMLFCMFPRDLRLKTFVIFKKVWVVTCLIGILCYIVYVIKFPLPYERVAYYAGKGNQGYISYYVSFLFERSDGLLRLYGICNEPGVLGTVCGLILCASHMNLRKKENIILLIAGFLTFSMAFFVLLMLYAMFLLIVKICQEKNITRKIIKVACVLLCLGLCFFVLPNVKTGNTTIDYTLSRFAITEEGFVGDDRTTEKFDRLYEETSLQDKMFGLGKSYLKSHNIVKNLSYKVYILEYGIVWCALMWGGLLAVSMHYSKKDKFALIFVLLFFASIYQRPNIVTSTYAIILFGGIEYAKSSISRRKSDFRMMYCLKKRFIKRKAKKVIGKPKLMHFIPVLNIGGAETMVKNYLIEIDKEKFDVVLLCLDRAKNPLYEKTLLENGIRVIYAEDYLLIKHAPKKIKKIIGYVQKYLIARYFIRTESPDILHLHLYMNTVIRFAHPRSDTVMLYTVHSEPSKIWLENTRKVKAEFSATKWLVKKYDMKFITLHEKMRQEVDEMFGVNDSIVLNNGVRLEDYNFSVDERQKVRKDLGIRADSFVVGHIGRFAAVKNHEFLVQVFIEVLKKKPNSMLLMVGDGEEKERIKKVLKKKGIQDRCVILSNRKDVPALLSVMDAFVFPSKYEGLGIALIEAQIARVACFVSDDVPNYAKISNFVTRLSLLQEPNVWADAIVSYHMPERLKVNDKDWDIVTVTRELEKVYNNALLDKI